MHPVLAGDRPHRQTLLVIESECQEQIHLGRQSAPTAQAARIPGSRRGSRARDSKALVNKTAARTHRVMRPRWSRLAGTDGLEPPTSAS